MLMGRYAVTALGLWLVACGSQAPDAVRDHAGDAGTSSGDDATTGDDGASPDAGDTGTSSNDGGPIPLTLTDVASSLGLPKLGTQCLAFEDFDGDGRVDVLTLPAPAPGPTALTLYLNRSNGPFEAKASSLKFNGFENVSCTVGDFDNDGRPDVVAAVEYEYVVHLLHNNGDGTFQEVTALALPQTTQYQTGGGVLAMADFDQDGWLDIVATYYQSPPQAESCAPTQQGFACNVPSPRCGLRPVAFRNKGDGSFASPVFIGNSACPPANTNALTIIDYNGDGRPDIFVANDWGLDALYQQTGGPLQFIDLAPSLSLKGYNDGMGGAFADYDLDGNLDFYVSDTGSAQFYLGRGGGAVAADGPGWGVTTATMYTSGWAPLADDFDSDGFTDIWVTNAALVHSYSELAQIAGSTSGDAGVTQTQGVNSDFLFKNNRGQAFDLLLFPQTLDAFPIFGPGCTALADYDGDGRLDIVEAVGSPQRFQLMHNDGPHSHYLELRLTGHKSNRDGIGAWITLKQSGRPDVSKYLTRTRGSVGSSWAVTHFGLGSRTDVAEVDITWPTGAKQTITAPAADQLLKVDEP